MVKQAEDSKKFSEEDVDFGFALYGADLVAEAIASIDIRETDVASISPANKVGFNVYRLQCLSMLVHRQSGHQLLFGACPKTS